jgi:DNA-directed RNA polymerase specialized sigma24 family protein
MTVSIDHLIDKHKHWIAVVKRFGEIAYAEDIVQEAYIKIIDSNKDVNFAYFYFTLRSLTMNLHHKKVIKIEITKDIEHLLVDHDSGNELLIDKIQPFIDYIQTWEDYERMLFMVYVNKGVSMRKMARESGISFTSIYNTIKNCKKKLIQWQKEKQKD